MPAALYLTGHRFGKLVAQYMLNERKWKKIVWHCICDCGNYIDVPTGALTTGNTSSCGCLPWLN